MNVLPIQNSSFKIQNCPTTYLKESPLIKHKKGLLRIKPNYESGNLACPELDSGKFEIRSLLCPSSE